MRSAASRPQAASASRVALLGRQRTILARQNLGEHHVARNFDVDRAACAARQHAVDLARRGFRIIQNGGADGQFLEYLLLRIEGADLVMEERVGDALFRARRAGDDDDRRAFGVGLGDGIGDLQAADRIGDAGRTKSLEPRVRIRRETRALLVAGVDDLERTLLHLVEEGEHIVAGNTEDVADSLLAEAADQIAADGFAHARLPVFIAVAPSQCAE